MNNRTLMVATGLLLLVALLWVIGVLGRGGNRPDSTRDNSTEESRLAANQRGATPRMRQPAGPIPASTAGAASDRPPPATPADAGTPDENAWARLQALLGPCEPVGMGDALCREPLPADRPLEAWARAKYLVLANKNWEVFEPEAWLANFHEVTRRPSGMDGKIIDELLARKGDHFELVVENFLTNRDDAAELRTALTAVFDGPHMAEVVVYAIGDGAALNGLLIVGRHRTGDEATCAYHLWD
jgi:hypothetical protein